MYQPRSIRHVSSSNTGGNQPMFLRQLSAVGSSFLPLPQSQPVLLRAAGYRSTTTSSSSSYHLSSVTPHPPWWSTQGSRPWPPPPPLRPSHRAPRRSHPVRTSHPYPQLRARDQNIARGTVFAATYNRGVPPPWFASPLAGGSVPRSGLHTSGGLMDGEGRGPEPPYKRRKSTEDEKTSGAASEERGGHHRPRGDSAWKVHRHRPDPSVTGGPGPKPRRGDNEVGRDRQDQEWETVGRRKNSARRECSRDKDDCKQKDRDGTRDRDKKSRHHSGQKERAASSAPKGAKLDEAPRPGKGTCSQGSRWDSQQPRAPRAHSSEQKPRTDPGAAPGGHKPNPWFKDGPKGVAGGAGNVQHVHGQRGGPWRPPWPGAGVHPNPWFPGPLPSFSALQRNWETLPGGRRRPPGVTPFEFSVLSYNILSQELLRDNSYLYRHCHPMVLPWEYRLPNLLAEIRHYDADILCLQEVQEDHYEKQIKPALQEFGYQCEYKKRTGGKPDGCAVAFKASRLALVSAHPVEYLRPGISVLDRDNVGLVVLLQPDPPGGAQIGDPSDFICVANTHLLYNPRRGDVKLAQLAVLLAEVSRLSRLPDGSANPVVMCGDFNSTPWSPLYHLLTMGFLEYQGMPIGRVSGQERDPRQHRFLTTPLWPSSLGINTHCQYNTTQQRQSDTTQSDTTSATPGNNTGALEEDVVVSEATPDPQPPVTASEESTVGDDGLRSRAGEVVDLTVDEDGKNKPELSQKAREVVDQTVDEHGVEGAMPSIVDLIAKTHINRPRIDHSVKLRSSYQHILAHGQAYEVTTCHTQTAMTVDYIMYTPDPGPDSRLPGERGLELLGRLSLVGEAELDAVNRLPNQHHSSDHLPLLARFRLH